MTRNTEILVIGAGTAGLHAAAEARRAGRDLLVVDGGPLGTTCARVGCMPSKAMVQAGHDVARARVLSDEGIYGGEAVLADLPAVLAHVRAARDDLVRSTLAGAVEPLGDRLLRARARLLEPGLVELDDGTRVRAEAIVLAVGSRPVVPGAWRGTLGDSLLTTDTLFEEEDLTGSLGVVGLGPVGLELGQALARLGVHVVGVDMQEFVGGVNDPVVARALIEHIQSDLPLWLGEPASLERAEGGRVRLRAGDRVETVDRVLVSLGRRSNLDRLAPATLGVPLEEGGLLPWDEQTMQVGQLPVFLAGDVKGGPDVYHGAASDGRIAGHNAARWPDPPRRFRRAPRLGIVFTDPTTATIGAPWRELTGCEEIAVGAADLARNGRVRVSSLPGGLLRIYAQRSDGRLLGASLCAPAGEHLAHALAWAIAEERTVPELLARTYYHPTLEEGLQSALKSLLREIEPRLDYPLGLRPA